MSRGDAYKQRSAMSLGYAERLSEKDDYGGPLGQKESFENADAIEEKVWKNSSCALFFSPSPLIL